MQNRVGQSLFQSRFPFSLRGCHRSSQCCMALRVVCNAFPTPNGRGIGQDITGTIRKQVELGQLLSGLQREDRTQIVPYRRILRIADDGLTARSPDRESPSTLVMPTGNFHRDETPLPVTGQRDIFAVNGVRPAGLSPPPDTGEPYIASMSSRTCSLYSRFPPAAAQCALENRCGTGNRYS